MFLNNLFCVTQALDLWGTFGKQSTGRFQISGISAKHFRSSRSVHASKTTVSECHIWNRPIECFPNIPHKPHVCVTQQKLSTKHYWYCRFINSKVWNFCNFHSFRVPSLKLPSRVLLPISPLPPLLLPVTAIPCQICSQCETILQICSFAVLQCCNFGTV